MIYTVTLNPALDYDIYLDNLNEAKNVNIRAGGKGVNVSKVLNTLGHNSISTGFTAGFLGDFIKEDLKNDGIKNDFVNLKGNTRLNIKIKTDKDS